jgi:hemoglobin/transferrin/lactoferrin receptor protein
VAWKAAASSTLRLNLSQGYRFATLQQLYMGTVHGSSSPTFGNPDLKPETSRSVELGWRTHTERAAVDVAVFRSENRDYITTLLSPTPTYPNALQFRNVDRATSQGLEAAATLQATPTLSPYTSFTWLRRRFESTGFTTSKTGSPSLFGQAGLRYETAARTGFGFHADAFLRFADRADLASSNGTVEAVPGWTTLNLSTGLHFGARGQHQVAVNFQNLLDRRYLTAFETVLMAGRSVAVSLRSTF